MECALRRVQERKGRERARACVPGRVAVDSVREIARLPTTSVIVVTDREQADFAFAALRSGASGFLLTDCEPGELVGAVRAVAGGDVALSPSVTRRLIA
jgi:DNA-binding NarL/FixJ family response regulator